MKEFDLIESIRQASARDSGDVLLGIGDDAAILDLPAGESLVVTTDTLNEGIHFLPSARPYGIGHKALAVNLSDLAAMAAIPRWVTLNLSMPDADQAWLDGFMTGFMALADQYSVHLVGGDTCRGPLSIAVTAMGSIAHGEALRRSGASAGDLVIVSGIPGLAALALQHIRQGQEPHEALRNALEQPQPRLALGLALRGVASACIDVSDGLLADLRHLAVASGLGADIALESLPADESFSTLDIETRWTLQLCGGDDYELCFTVAANDLPGLEKKMQDTGVRLTVIGTMVEGDQVVCRRPDGQCFEPASSGHIHFEEVR